MAIDQQALNDIAEIFQFEYWLRFYFVQEQNQHLAIQVPDDALEEVKAGHPGLYDLAVLMNGRIIDQQSSLEQVCSYVGSRLDGPKYTSNVISRVLDSKEFQVEMQLFNLWAQGHEAHLDEERRSFAQWRELYAGWNALDKVREVRARLLTAKENEAAPGCQTTH